MPVSKTYTTWFDGHLDHPDTQKLAGALERLGLPRRWRDWVGNVVPLLNLYCLQHQEDGDLTHLPAERIAQICRWPIGAKAEEFVGALKFAGVLDEQEQPDGGVKHVVHNFRYYARRVLNERERKRTIRGQVHGQTHGQETAKPATRPQVVRGQSADASADKVAPIVIGSVIGTGTVNLKDRERPLSVVKPSEGVDSPEQPKTAGAARPTLEKQAGTGNGNGEEPGAGSEKRGNGGETAGQDTARPPIQPELTTENPAPDWDPPRPEDIQTNVSMCGELLRRWGWTEDQVRRVLRWLIVWRRGEWLRRSCEGDFWVLLALAKQIENWRAAGNEVRDSVSMLISLMGDGKQPKPENYRLAKSAWIFLDGEPARVDPPYILEILALIGGQAVPAGGAARSVAETRAALGVD